MVSTVQHFCHLARCSTARLRLPRHPGDAVDSLAQVTRWLTAAGFELGLDNPSEIPGAPAGQIAGTLPVRPPRSRKRHDFSVCREPCHLWVVSCESEKTSEYVGWCHWASVPTIRPSILNPATCSVGPSNHQVAAELPGDEDAGERGTCQGGVAFTPWSPWRV